MFCKADKFTQSHGLAFAILWVFLCNSPPAFLCRDDYVWPGLGLYILNWLSHGSRVHGSLIPHNILLYKKSFRFAHLLY